MARLLYASISLECSGTDVLAHKAQANEHHQSTVCALQKTRRAQLVLADRAFHLQETAKKLGLTADRPLWSALIQCAGQSGQLSRAFQLLDEMMIAGIKPDAQTFVILIDACVMVRAQQTNQQSTAVAQVRIQRLSLTPPPHWQLCGFSSATCSQHCVNGLTADHHNSFSTKMCPDRAIALRAYCVTSHGSSAAAIR